MEQCASTASLLASVREQERQFEMLSRALEEERRSCAGTLPRPLPNMQVMRTRPHGRCFLSSSCTCPVESVWPSPFVLSVVTFILPSIWSCCRGFAWGVNASSDLPVQPEGVIYTRRCSLTPCASHFHRLIWFPGNRPRPLVSAPQTPSSLSSLL